MADTNATDTANRLYSGTIATGPAARPRRTDDFAPVPRDVQHRADTLYDGNAAAVPTGAGPKDFYGHSHLAQAIEGRKAELWDNAGVGDAERDGLRENFIEIAKRTGLPEELVRDIAGHHIDGRLADVRPGEADTAAREVQIAAWNTEIREELAVRYGRDAESMLERTRAFARRHPALGAVLRDHGVGSRPDVVLRLAAHVFSNGIR